jgi:hypothetical protein
MVAGYCRRGIARGHIALGLVVLGASALVSDVAYGQGNAPAGIACREVGCQLSIDWGVGQSSVDMPPDRKYGGPADFDKAIRAALAGHNMAAAGGDAAPVAVRIKASYKTRVLCDDMPGTTPDRSCATIGEAIITFSSADSTMKLPTAARLINRCGASEAVMSMKQFGTYVGETIWYTVEGSAKKASKPSGRC